MSVDWPLFTYPALNPFYLDRIFIALSAFFGAYWLQREGKKNWPNRFSIILLVLGLCWWFGGGIYEILRYVNKNYLLSSWMVFISLSFVVIFYISRHLAWKALGIITRSQLWIMYLMLFLWVISLLWNNLNYNFCDAPTAYCESLYNTQLFSHGDYFAWFIAFGVDYALWHYHDTPTVSQKSRVFIRPAAIRLLIILIVLVGLTSSAFSHYGDRVFNYYLSA